MTLSTAKATASRLAQFIVRNPVRVEDAYIMQISGSRPTLYLQIVAWFSLGRHSDQNERRAVRWASESDLVTDYRTASQNFSVATYPENRESHSKLLCADYTSEKCYPEERVPRGARCTRTDAHTHNRNNPPRG